MYIDRDDVHVYNQDGMATVVKSSYQNIIVKHNNDNIYLAMSFANKQWLSQRSGLGII